MSLHAINSSVSLPSPADGRGHTRSQLQNDNVFPPHAEDRNDPVENEEIEDRPLIFKDVPVENHRWMRVVVIGAGFSGIYCGVRIPQRLRNVELCIYEKNPDVGGSWYENRYPGCACDVPCELLLSFLLSGRYGRTPCADDIPAHSYQYTFEPNPFWSRVYATAPEIHKYLKDVASKYSANRFIKLSHQVVDVEWHQDVSKWLVACALKALFRLTHMS